ncbi:hypothetical protein CHGG_08202 [Chaetomium globosum CBS 148.51]|uniref:Uncharacterized protein n=1 Tax=Chaetomium globosum (strain ATCC 6205 / CBS 148.51 / DSM 1962 / NBRC 6347 / NRRL 1970) TaxID=306901 RepID=Q2GV02_CHAGB|nr:uncharacterized protein CHGG_08202 [Chaetomium globosum CBS 148.51]EAQ86949.1 hypothetical protein CHGG_08202 [Chaetomium globosum CBS 148.51]
MAEPNTNQSNGVSTTSNIPPATTYTPRYIDIGINLADPIFRGRYHGKSRHPDDLKGVVGRAIEVGCSKLIVTGSSFKSSRDALKLAKEFPGTVFATAGIHPCSSSIFSSTHHKHHDESQSEGEDGEEAEHTPACGPDPTKPILDGDGVDHARSAKIMTDLADLITQARSSSNNNSSSNTPRRRARRLRRVRPRLRPAALLLQRTAAAAAAAAAETEAVAADPTATSGAEGETVKPDRRQRQKKPQQQQQQAKKNQKKESEVPERYKVSRRRSGKRAHVKGGMSHV